MWAVSGVMVLLILVVLAGFATLMFNLMQDTDSPEPGD